MPCIQTKVNVSISPEQEARLKTGFGELMPILRKSEDWLMLTFEDRCRLYFKGETALRLSWRLSFTAPPVRMPMIE